MWRGPREDSICPAGGSTGTWSVRYGVRHSRGRRDLGKVKDYLRYCKWIVGRAQIAFAQLEQCHPVPILALLSIDEYLGHAARQLDQVERRLLKGETIPQNQKVFSIFESHTRWVVKGKVGVPMELGVPVCVVEDQFQFLLHHKIMWQDTDVDVAVSMVEENTGSICRFSHVQFRPGISQSEQSPAIGRDAGAQCAAAQGLFEPGGAGARTRTGVCDDAQTASGRGVGDQQS